ncbi:MAG: winged helix-turn-helix domain-containing protein, partial [Candidatus Tectomicrobia bacterium]|nr:winged helix-turn-helix domain-containing protein [Candidatus Tectomicrobia bacterium]
MSASRILVFGLFRLDLADEGLWRGEEVLRLTNKAFAVLSYLVEHAGQLVTKEALLDAVWPDTFVSDAALTVCIRELRQALADRAQTPHFIETVRGRGYRFIAAVEEALMVPEPTATSLGNALQPCPSCHHPNPPTARFCNACGTALQGSPPSEKGQAPSAEGAALDAERRQLTVLFCDLVESTKLSSQLDPEDWRDIVRAYQEVGAAVVARFDGYIAQYLGDGLLVYFGYPQAHEDDAQRAVRAGLGIVEAIGDLNARLYQPYGVRVGVRLGIHTGLVVVGAMGGGDRQEHLALGEAPNVASRLQALAAPDTVVISATTYRLVQGYFACDALGSHALKGLDTPLDVYRMVQSSASQSRFDIARHHGLPALVGREQEMGLLLERWNHAKAGHGQVVLLSGEAGIGKSRLMQALKDHIAQQSYTQFECRSSPYSQHTAFYPILDLLQRILQWQMGESSEIKLEKLERVLSHYRLALDESVPLLAHLLSLPLPDDRYPPLNLSPQRQRQKTLDTLLALLLELVEYQPLLFILEDLHWTDPSTLELLERLVDQTPAAALLTLLTSRPPFQPSWSSRSYCTQVTLSRLPRDQVAQMVEEFTGEKPLPGEVMQQLAEKTDGVPLFVEELTKAVLESGMLNEADGQYELSETFSALTIPSTLQDTLMARLDHLDTAKGVAQLGATIGRQFSATLLRAVSHLEEAALQQELDRLVQAELLYPRGVGPQTIYIFKHALIRDAAYQSLLHRTRQHYHQRIADILEAQFPETAEHQPELVAHHYTEARLSEQAIPYWQQAGQHAAQRSAHVEAAHHLRKALELLADLPVTEQRKADELVLLTTLGPLLTAIKGWASPDVGEAYTWALELCQQLGDPPELFSVLRGLWEFYEARAEYQTARELGEQLLNLAQRNNDLVLLIVSHDVLGDTLFWLGEFSASQAHIDHGLALYDRQQHHSHTVLYGAYDPGVLCLYFAALNLWWMGYPQQAWQRIQETLSLAQDLKHPYSMVFARCAASWVHQLRGEPYVGLEHAERAVAFSTEQELELLLAWGTILRGWALSGLGKGGITQMQQGLAAWRETGAELLRPYFLALIAEAYGKERQAEAGLNVLDEAIALVEKTGERFWEAELYRLKGELSLM